MILIPEQCYQKISIQNEDNVLITLFMETYKVLYIKSSIKGGVVRGGLDGTLGSNQYFWRIA